MNSQERRAVALLASIYALRIAGLFLILPVFALFAGELVGHTPLLIGLALGAYGLTQAVLQIPFGWLSDHYGRKPVIAGGLLLFALGSVIAATASHIWIMILGRAVQGAGAIAAAIMATVADLTREEQRAKAMAAVGMTIGGTFVLSLVVGPLLHGRIGVPGIFWLTGALAIVAIGALYRFLPTPVRVAAGRRDLRRDFGRILRNRQLLALDAGIFVLHLTMTAMFVVLPLVIVRELGLAGADHWAIYLPVMLVGFLAMVPFLILANRRHRHRAVMAGAIAVLALAQLLLVFGQQSLYGLVTGLTLFFAAFSLLEAQLPSLVSRLAPAANKGAAIGVYSSAQFFGAFAGGTLGGLLHGVAGFDAVFWMAAGVLALWLVLVLTLPEPQLLASHQIRVGNQSPRQAASLAERLGRVPGVAEAVVVAEEGMAYLKIDARVLDKKHLEQFGSSV
jgi:MFS family permease